LSSYKYISLDTILYNLGEENCLYFNDKAEMPQGF